VDSEIAKYLININFQFYQTFSSYFSATRRVVQPGVKQILSKISADESILDIGCGNGNAWHALIDSGYKGMYVGVDFSPELLSLARSKSLEKQQKLKNSPAPVFISLDLSDENWDMNIPSIPFDHIVAFAMLHHIPGKSMRINILKKIKHMMARDGEFVLSAWQFMNSKRLKSRVVDWSNVGLSDQQLDGGDFLLDWRSGGMGLRYIHLFSEQELKDLADTCGFQVISSFHSDGAENKLGLYQIWKLAQK
jgi:tRNA (uracil-5-)-methyltransferase TRM9